MIANEGSVAIIARSADNKLYSDQKMIIVQAPPKPQFQYIGAKLAARGNNDTGYFLETGADTSARSHPLGPALTSIFESRGIYTESYRPSL